MAGPARRGWLLRNHTRQCQTITCYSQDTVRVRVQNHAWKSLQQSPFSVQGAEKMKPSCRAPAVTSAPQGRHYSGLSYRQGN